MTVRTDLPSGRSAASETTKADERAIPRPTFAFFFLPFALTMLQIQIFLDEDDMHEGRPLHEYILRHLMHHRIKGATLFRGAMGFGAQHHLHAPARIGALDERPIMITFIDEPEKTTALLPHLREVLVDGLIVSHEVEIW